MIGAEEQRALVRELLDGHAAADEREGASIARILDEVERLDAPYDEHADATHVTGSAIVVGRRGVLLLVHRRLGFWMQPGGHVEAGETPADAALRETVEETGLAAVHPTAGPRLVHADVHEAPKGHTHLDLRFLLRATTDADPLPPLGESQLVRWFTWDDAVAVADASLRSALVVAHEIVAEGG